MKKFLCTAAFIFIAVLAVTSVVWAGKFDEPDIIIRNVEKLTNGKRVGVEDVEYGFPSSASIDSRIYSYEARKIYTRYGGAEVVIKPKKGEFVFNKAREGKAPTKANGLVNPGKPIVLTGHAGLLVFDYIHDFDYQLGLLDDKGYPVNLVRDNSRLEMTPDSTKDYYIELSVKNAKNNVFYGEIKYYLDPKNVNKKSESDRAYKYVMIRVMPSSREPKIDAEGMKYAHEAINKHMREHSIKSYDAITEKDDDAIVDMFTMYPGIKRMIEVVGRPAVDAYMKEHGMSLLCELKGDDLEKIYLVHADKDKKTIHNQLGGYMEQKNISNLEDLASENPDDLKDYMLRQSLAKDPNMKAVFDNYMKKNNIKRYGDLTEKDMANIEKMFKSSGNLKKTVKDKKRK